MVLYELPIFRGAPAFSCECAEVPCLLQLYLHFYLFLLPITPACPPVTALRADFQVEGRGVQPWQLEARGKEGTGYL